MTSRRSSMDTDEKRMPPCVSQGVGLRQKPGFWPSAQRGTGQGHAGGAEKSTFMSRRRNCLEVEQIGDVSVAKFTTHRVHDEEKMQRIGDQLISLGEQAGHRPLVLNMRGVRGMSTGVV